MATYRVYDNILIKMENVFLQVEMEVDKEITSLLNEHTQLNKQLSDLKNKIETLNSLKRSYELYCDNEYEMESLQKSLFKMLCDKKIQLRFLQEKELLVNGFLLANQDQLPTVIQLNKEFKLRKKLQEIELLARFLADDERFARFQAELERANDVFDLAIESGANDKLEGTINLFQHFFDKVINIYDLDSAFLNELADFRSQILLQANSITWFTPQEVENLKVTYRAVLNARIQSELEVDNLLYQYTMFQNGKKIIIAEIKNASCELESVLFKEYAIKQKIQELKQYKIELNSQKEGFMKDPTVDGYTEAVQQLEYVETRFRRLIMHKSFEKTPALNRLYAENKLKTENKLRVEQTSYNKNLFQALHNSHISSRDKMMILRLSKPSKLIHSLAGKCFCQRTGKARSLKNLEHTMKKLQLKDLH